MTTEQVLALQKRLVAEGYMTQAEMDTGPGVFGPRTTAAYKKALATGISSDPELSTIAKTNSAEAIINAQETGDFSGLVNTSGQPFSEFDQQEAVKASEAALEPFYKAQEEKATADTEADIEKKKLSFQQEIANNKIGFESDKASLDQSAADRGVLFSGSRVQKQKALESKYATADEAARSTAASGIGDTARNFQYQYGTPSANKLSEKYNLGTGNVYDATVATGGATPKNGLSAIYNPSKYNFQGTANTDKSANVQKRAASILANKASKLLGAY